MRYDDGEIGEMCRRAVAAAKRAAAAGKEAEGTNWAAGATLPDPVDGPTLPAAVLRALDGMPQPAAKGKKRKSK